MSTGYWDQVQAADFEVPADRPLDDLTAELTTMLGSTQPEVRDGTAYPALATWIDRGVYDDLLAGLGDGMVAGLAVGLGETGTDTVFRRSFSALIVGECLERDNEQHLLPSTKILDWGDRIAVWFLTERDSRGFVPDKGWAHAIAHGADAIGALGESPHMSARRAPGPPRRPRRAPAPAARRRAARRRRAGPDGSGGDADPPARHPGRDVLEPWVHRLGAAGNPFTGPVDHDPYAPTAAPQAFLRALFVQLSLAPSRPPVRSDLLLVVIEALRLTNAPGVPASSHR